MMELLQQRDYFFTVLPGVWRFKVDKKATLKQLIARLGLVAAVGNTQDFARLFESYDRDDDLSPHCHQVEPRTYRLIRFRKPFKDMEKAWEVLADHGLEAADLWEVFTLAGVIRSPWFTFPIVATRTLVIDDQGKEFLHALFLCGTNRHFVIMTKDEDTWSNRMFYLVYND